MRSDHPLRERFEKELARLKADLHDLQGGRFRLWQRTVQEPKEVDITQDAIDRTKYNIDLYERILAED